MAAPFKGERMAAPADEKFFSFTRKPRRSRTPRKPRITRNSRITSRPR